MGLFIHVKNNNKKQLFLVNVIDKIFNAGVFLGTEIQNPLLKAITLKYYKCHIIFFVNINKENKIQPFVITHFTWPII